MKQFTVPVKPDFGWRRKNWLDALTRIDNDVLTSDVCCLFLRLGDRISTGKVAGPVFNLLLPDFKARKRLDLYQNPPINDAKLAENEGRMTLLTSSAFFLRQWGPDLSQNPPRLRGNWPWLLFRSGGAVSAISSSAYQYEVLGKLEDSL